jgi:asparagine synthase (glutamine-hydrolysing)
MSALGGIFNFGNDPPPLDREMLTALGKRLELRGPDGGGEASNAHVGMTYRSYHTTRESQFEIQPVASSDGVMLTWDGRLDNRDELISELYTGTQGEKIITDVEIVLAAYLRWRQKSFVRLVGDFGLALWDSQLRTLLLVRDVLGTRPLNYFVDRKRIVWSSELLPLLDVANVPREVDEEYVAGFLARYPRAGLTPYKNVFTVKPQHVVTVNQAGQVNETRYWGLDTSREIRYRRDEDYEEQFIHEFSLGLKSQLRSHRPVFSELSGGLDSSSIVCAANRLVKNREVQTPGLETISHVYDESTTADESRFIECVEQHIGHTGYHLKESQYPLSSGLDRTPTFVPNGVDGFTEYYRGAQKIMDQHHARVLLSGEGGDQMLGSSDDPSPELCDLLVQAKLLALHNRLQVWSGALKRPYLWLLWQRTIMPTFLHRSQKQLPRWFNADFVERNHMREIMDANLDIYGFRLPSGRDQSAGFVSVVNHIAAGYRRAHFNVEIRYPYLHRPLVEFLQAIPVEQSLRPGETRSLMRRSFNTLLPERIARRRTKGDPHESICRAVIRELPRLRELFKDARASACGYVEPAALTEALESAGHGLRVNFIALLKTISLEFWLRTLECPELLTEAFSIRPAYSSGSAAAQMTLSRAEAMT